MVVQHGTESWRKMSRFRRSSQAKPSAAEVLEPRCVLTEVTGTLAVADAAPLTGAVVVDASLWDDAGLTLQRIGDLVHVFRTGSQSDVITPMLASAITSLNIIGRANAADVLTMDVWSGDWSWLYPNVFKVNFDGGTGAQTDRIRLVDSGNHWGSESIGYRLQGFGSGEILGFATFSEKGQDVLHLSDLQHFNFGIDYDNVEIIEDQIADAMEDVFFGPEDNHLIYDALRDDGTSSVNETGLETTIVFAPRTLREDFFQLHCGPGNDQVEVVVSRQETSTEETSEGKLQIYVAGTRETISLQTALTVESS